jgi:hypothetical protein
MATRGNIVNGGKWSVNVGKGGKSCSSSGVKVDPVIGTGQDHPSTP